MMTFAEITSELNQANTYLDMYDIVEGIVDDKLRQDVLNTIETGELNNKSINDVQNEVKSLINVPKNMSSLDEYVELIKSASNNKDLLNIINSMDDNDNINDDDKNNLHTIYRNNRFMSLKNTKKAILKYITNNKKITESVIQDSNDGEIDTTKTNDIDVDDTDNIDKVDIEFDIENDIICSVISKRIGQQMTVSDLNSLLQTTFNQFNKVFILKNDLYNVDLDKTQTIEIEDTDYIYYIKYDVIDVDNGIIEIKDCTKEEVVE